MNALVNYSSGSDSDSNEPGSVNVLPESVKNKDFSDEDGDYEDAVDSSKTSQNLLINDEDEDEAYEKALKYLEQRHQIVYSVDKSEEEEKKEKLPNPLSTNTQILEQSVFQTHYHKTEEAKLSVLEKHVKITEKDLTAQTINGKKVCWMYRKGRCKKGHRCPFAHDNDLDTAEDQTATTSYALGHGFFASDSHVSNTHADNDDDSYTAPKHKRRYGVTDTLMPPKKARPGLEQQRAKERPWTFNSNSKV